MQDIQDKIFDIIADKGNVDRDKIKPESTLEDLELESLDVVEIIFELEEQFDIEIPFNANEDTTTGATYESVQDVVAAVAELVKAKQD